MNVVVLSGSPKGEKSITFQYVRYIQKVFPTHRLEVQHLVPRMKKLEADEAAFTEIVERVHAADAVLWAFPVYYFLVHGSYKRFIELLFERGAVDAFRDKIAAGLSTSIHFYDHIAHHYIHAISEDLDMRYLGGFSADMPDLLGERGRAQLEAFASEFFRAAESGAAIPRRFPPLAAQPFDYRPGPPGLPAGTGGRRAVILTDARPDEGNLLRMVERFQASLGGGAERVNLRDLDIKGGCLGCLRCGYDNECAYEGKDGFTAFYREQLVPADMLVLAGALHDRYLSAAWKTFFDRSFFMGHAPSLMGKQFAFIVSGPLGQVPDLRLVLETWVDVQRSNVAGFVSDEAGDSAAVDAQLDELAARLARYCAAGMAQPPTFPGLAARRHFRDEIYGRLRFVFQADDRAYRRLGAYDFPQKDYRQRFANAVLVPLLRSRRFREGFKQQVVDRMVAPYQKVVE